MKFTMAPIDVVLLQRGKEANYDYDIFLFLESNIDTSYKFMGYVLWHKLPVNIILKLLRVLLHINCCVFSFFLTNIDLFYIFCTYQFQDFFFFLVLLIIIIIFFFFWLVNLPFNIYNML